MEGDVIMLQDLFIFDFAAGMDDEGKFRGRLKSTGLRPKFVDKLEERGVYVDPEVFALEHAGRELMIGCRFLLGEPRGARARDRPRDGRSVPAGRHAVRHGEPSPAAADHRRAHGGRRATAGASRRHVPAMDRTAGGWIPAKVTNFGRRFADARGFSGRLDAELEAAAVSLRSGEFVIVTVLASFGGMILGYAILKSPWLALGVGAVSRSRTDGRAEVRLGTPCGEAPRTASGRAHDHGELAPGRPQLPAGARHDGEGDRTARRHRVPAGRRRDPPGTQRRGRARGAVANGWGAPTSSGPSSR